MICIMHNLEGRHALIVPVATYNRSTHEYNIVMIAK